MLIITVDACHSMRFCYFTLFSLLFIYIFLQLSCCVLYNVGGWFFSGGGGGGAGGAGGAGGGAGGGSCDVVLLFGFKLFAHLKWC